MAGETVKTEAICLDIRPWSRTSHVVTWLTPSGKVTTVVKGAERPKSLFLGQYDLNYRCEIIYYAQAKGDLHALRECVPVDLREGLRGDYRALALASYCRKLAGDLAPAGADCRAWYETLERTLDACASRPSGAGAAFWLPLMLRYELSALELSGLRPDFSGYGREAEWTSFSVETGSFSEGGGRCVRISRAVASFLDNPCLPVENLQIPLDAARVIGVFYQFHLDCASDVRRVVLGMIA